jgi:acetoin utilization protein AcuB
MNKGHETIAKFMTRTPFSIEPSQPLEEARKLMGRHEIRHLPVLSGGRIVGLLSERDLTYIRTLPGVGPDLKVKDAMVYDPVLVSETDALKDVARKMADMHIGSVLVCDHHNKLAGIFTYTDALKVLAES